MIILFVSWFFTAGNFGVVYKAWYTQESVQTKVAIKTLKGDLRIVHTVQLNLKLTEHVCCLVSTWHIFILQLCRHCLCIQDRRAWTFRALMYTLDVCTIVYRSTHACQERTCQIWFCVHLSVHANCKSRYQYNLYEHVHVLMRDSPHDTKHKPLIEFLTVKLKPIEYNILVCLFHWLSLVICV